MAEDLMLREQELIRTLLREMEPDTRIILHGKRCKLLRKAGVCTCAPVIIDRMAQA